MLSLPFPTLLFSLTPLYAILVVGVIALVLGLVILVIFKLFHVEVDEREEEINELLPGANCGGCGYSGCQGYASALAQGTDTDLTKCTAGGQETVNLLATYFGQEAGAFIPKVARVHCQGSQDKVQVRYEYTGSQDCRTASQLFGGPNSCSFGCVGYGDCRRACDYGAITIENGLARIDSSKCIACGACVLACPRNLIRIEPKYTDLFTVNCSNPLPGKESRKACDISCIGCTLCVRNCPEEAISMQGSLAVIDQEKCIQCGKCLEVCPTKAIVKGL